MEDLRAEEEDVLDMIAECFAAHIFHGERIHQWAKARMERKERK